MRFFSLKAHKIMSKIKLRSRLSLSEANKIKLNALSSKDLTALLPDHSVHQGFAAIVGELYYGTLDFQINRCHSTEYSFVVVLDQVTDPHNLGAVIRSAVAFSADAIIVHDRSTPRLDGALGKAASGALEHIPIIRTKNIARAIDKLKKAEFWCIGYLTTHKMISRASAFIRGLQLYLEQKEKV